MEYILIVDDKKENLLAYEAILEGKDRTLVMALSGQEGLNRVLDHEYAMIILDVQMPEMDGFEFARLVKGNKQTQQIPIIFITAAITDLSSVTAGYNVGAVDYLAKPISSNILRSKVDAFLEMHRTKSEMSSLLDEHKKAQESLIKLSEDLKRTNDDLTRFSYACSHDLKSPLRNVKVLIEMLDEELKGNDLNNSSRELISRACSTIVRMEELIESVVSYSWAQHSEEAVVETDLNQLVMEVIEDLREDINAKQAVVSVISLPSYPCQNVKFRQFFANIISNSLHYCNKVPEITVSSSIENGELQIYIEDNGIGFDMRYADKIMKPFERLVSAHEFTGSGIGLSTCYTIAQGHGGHLSCQSTIGEGSTFTLHLPVKSVTTVDDDTPFDMEETVSHLQVIGEDEFKILSVDDDPMSQFLIKRTLSNVKVNSLNVRVEEAYNGLEAIEKIKGTDYNLIILDENMPILKGSETAGEIDKISKNSNRSIPIVAHSTMDLEELKKLYQGTGVNKFFTKFLTLNDANKLVDEIKAM
ncbi:MAG: response regulator [Lentisphaeraceae bacterium]|nr:response regulator [Lentisphaeraceae bacterium]